MLRLCHDRESSVSFAAVTSLADVSCVSACHLIAWGLVALDVFMCVGRLALLQVCLGCHQCLLSTSWQLTLCGRCPVAERTVARGVFFWWGLFSSRL